MNIRAELLCALKDLAIDTSHISGETRFKEDLEMDSTERVELAIALEKRLSLPVDDAILGKLSTFDEVEQFLQSLRGALVGSRSEGVKTHAAYTA